MQDGACVVVFPSELSRSRTARLAANIRAALKAGGQGFGSVRRDGDVVVVDANDPVFASSAIGRLFGVSKTAIARRADPDIKSVVSEASRLGGSLLLRDDRFLVRVGGRTAGYTPRDAEIAITSSIIEAKADLGAAPGSEAGHDKLLYTHVTRGSSYVCMFLDGGLGGVPNLSRGQATLCPVYDGISALSCIEAMRQGYEAKIIAVHGGGQDLRRVAKVVSRVIRFALRPEIELEFYSLRPGARAPAGYEFQASLVRLCLLVAEGGRIPKIALPMTGQLYPAGFVDSASRLVYKSGLVPHAPLEGGEDRIRRMARRYVLDGFFSGTPIRVQRGPKFPDVSHARFRGAASDAAETRRSVTVAPGPNSLHDILDSLG